LLVKVAFRVLNTIAWLALGAAVVLVSAQVILRFGFNRPQAWAEEVGRYLFVWSVYLGAIIALVKKTHIRLDLITEKLGRPAETLSVWLNRTIGLISFSFVAYFGYQLAYANRATQFYTLAGFPRIVFYLAVPICFSIMVLILLLPSAVRDSVGSDQ
jgi:TRAP-type C4-dicarboxylate transport system permease small subunit